MIRLPRIFCKLLFHNAISPLFSLPIFDQFKAKGFVQATGCGQFIERPELGRREPLSSYPA
jgi:hypothetical protein